MIKDRVINVVSDVLSIEKDKINLKSDKNNLHNWDSLKQMELILCLEKEFNTIIKIEEINKMVSIQAIIKILKEKVN